MEGAASTSSSRRDLTALSDHDTASIPSMPSIAHLRPDEQDDTDIPSVPSLPTDEEVLPISKAEAAVDPNVVDWDGPQDPKNPLHWSSANRWLQIAIISALTFTTPLASSMFAPGIGLLDERFHNTNDELSALVLSIFLLGFVFGPFIAAPLSETFGRLPVYHVSNLFFVIFSVACGVSSNLNMLIGFRFLQGTFGSVPPTLGGGTIADMMSPLQRGKAVGLWSLGPVLGPLVGPAGGGYLSMKVSWRWCFYVIAIFQGCLSLVALFVLKESYAPVLLARKAARLQKETGNPNLRSKLETNNIPLAQRIRLAVVRPMKLLVTPIVFILCLDVAMVYSYIYVLFTTFTKAYVDIYNFNIGESGLVYLGLAPGFLGGLAGMGIFSDRYVKRKSAQGEMKPEYRLPSLIPGAIVLPIGLFWYGWALEARVHWIVSIIGVNFVGCGLMLTFPPTQTYFIDAYTRYAASAIAANIVMRSLFGAILPLAGEPMYDKLGYGWGNSLLAFIALALVPAPFLIIKYGERIRKNPRFNVKL